MGNRRAQAESALHKGDRDKAAKLFEKVLEQEPGDLKVRRQLADLYRDAGQRADAIRHYEALAGGHAAQGLLLRAISSCKAILELDPDHHRTQEILASLYAKKRKGAPGETTLPPSMSAALMPAVPLDDDAEEEISDDDLEILHEAEATLDTNVELSDDDILTAQEVTTPPPAPMTAEAFTLGADDLEGIEIGDDDVEAEHTDELDVSGLHIATDEGYPVESMPSMEREIDGDELEISGLLETSPLPAPEGASPAGPTGSAAAPTDARASEEVTLSALPESPLFSDLSRKAFEELVTRLEVRQMAAGSVVVRQGDIGDSFFVIASGQVKVEREHDGAVHLLSRLQEGAFFGEIAIIAQNPRGATVTVEEDAELLEVSRAVLADLKLHHPSVEKVLRRFSRQRLLENLLRTSPLFAEITEDERREMVQAFKTFEAKEGEVVIAQGEQQKALFVILSGEAEVSITAPKGPVVVDTLAEGDVFGEMGLFFGEPANASVSATRPCQLLRLSGAAFVRFCARHPRVKARLEAIGRARATQNEKDRARYGVAVAPHPTV